MFFNIVISALILFVPTLFLFFGYKLNKFFIKFSCCVFIGLLFYYIGFNIDSVFNIVYIKWILFLIGFIVGYIISDKFYLFNIGTAYFLLVFLTFFILKLIFSNLFKTISDYIFKQPFNGILFVLTFIIGIIFTRFVLKYEKPAIIITTVITQIPLVFAGMTVLFLSENVFLSTLSVFIVSILFILFGFYYQCKNNGFVFGIGKETFFVTLKLFFKKETYKNIIEYIKVQKK